MILRAVASAAFSSPDDRSAVDSMYSTRVSLGLAFSSSARTWRAFARAAFHVDQRRGVADLQVAARLARAANRFFVGRGRILPLALALVELAELREVARIDLGAPARATARLRPACPATSALRTAAAAVAATTAPAPRPSRESAPRGRPCRREAAAARASSAGSDWSPSAACSGSRVRCSIAASRVEAGVCPAGGGAPPSAHAEYTVPRMLWASTLSLSIFSACSAAATASVGRFCR